MEPVTELYRGLPRKFQGYRATIAHDRRLNMVLHDRQDCNRLHGTDGLAILPANATGSVQAQVVPSLTLASTALAVDSHDRIYVIDAAVASQIDVGAVDQSGNFQLIGSLSNERICCPRLLLVDSNDNLVVPERNELDEFPFGSLGDVAPSIVQSVPPQPDLWTDAVFLPQTVPLPSPPPSSYITLSPDSVSLSTSASSTAQVTASEPGYSGQFQIGSSSCLDENADPHTFALVSPQSGTTFTISAPAGDLPGNCGISVDDSLGHRARYPSRFRISRLSSSRRQQRGPGTSTATCGAERAHQTP